MRTARSGAQRSVYALLVLPGGQGVQLAKLMEVYKAAGTGTSTSTGTSSGGTGTGGSGTGTGTTGGGTIGGGTTNGNTSPAVQGSLRSSGGGGGGGCTIGGRVEAAMPWFALVALLGARSVLRRMRRAAMMDAIDPARREGRLAPHTAA
jgi:hypothetical protein